MDPKVIGIISLRAAALALIATGNVKAGNTLMALAAAADSGRNIDLHMAQVAAKLKDRSVTDADWDQVTAAIEADSARLQSS